ncbi:MAG TPA: cytochrome P450 [Burkholderiales bacterium]|jgi:hypothetical protein|nr:cytochrome P450 [Burkholderiales bacterium]
MQVAFDLNRLDAAFFADPYPVYRELRERAPVHRMPDGSYFLTAYEDLHAIYRDAGTWSSDKRAAFKPKYGDSALYEHHTTSLVFNDPPYHTRVRRLLGPSFTPKALQALQPRIEGLVERLLERAAGQRSFDLIADFAAAIPVQLIGDMLGVPQDERGPLRAWSLAILGALEPTLTPQQLQAGVQAVEEFKEYLRGLVARRSGGGDAEILPQLVRASEFSAEPAKEKLSELELLHNCIFLLNAGHETTTNLIGNAVDLLLRHPASMERLQADPSLLPTAVEEFLRMESSNQLGNRMATRDTEVRGVPMPAGTYVHLCIGAANRDPAQFPDPDRLDLARQPNRHLAFAAGIHTCAGAALARMEGQVAIGALLRRFRTLEKAGTPARGQRARFRGFVSYPVSVR